MREQFNISGTHTFIPETSCLAIQLNSESFCYCLYEPAGKHLLQLKRYQFDELATGVLDAILSANIDLERAFDKIITSLDFGFNTLLPQEMSKGDHTPLMYLENADQQDHIIKEVLDEPGLANIYTVPPDILTWMVHHFPSSIYLHALSASIKNITDFPEEGLLRLDISEKHFEVVAYKSKKLLLAKKYTYAAPDDIVFYLLKICEAFGLSQEKALVHISGLIDEDSKLFRAVYDYFFHVLLKQADWNDVISNLPAHYFTSLNELIICGSLQEV